MADKQLGLCEVGGDVFVTLDGQPIDHSHRLTVTAAELVELSTVLVKGGVLLGTEQAKRTGPRKRYIQRDNDGRMIALIEEAAPTAEEAPRNKVPVRKVEAKQPIGFVKR